MQICIHVFIIFFIVSQYATDFFVVILGVWTPKAFDSLDKYLKLTFNPPATFFHSHQSIHPAEKLLQWTSAVLRRCAEVVKLQIEKRPRFTLDFKVLNHDQAAVSWSATWKKPLWNVFHHWRREPGLQNSQPCPACFDDHLLSFSTQHDPLWGLKGFLLSSQWRRVNYFAAGIQIRGSTRAAQLRGNKRREASETSAVGHMQ